MGRRQTTSGRHRRFARKLVPVVVHARRVEIGLRLAPEWIDQVADTGRFAILDRYESQDEPSTLVQPCQNLRPRDGDGRRADEAALDLDETQVAGNRVLGEDVEARV